MKTVYNINGFIHMKSFMSHTITTTLSDGLYTFLIDESQRQSTSKKAILEAALKEYRKQQLRKAVATGAQERHEEYQDIANELHEAKMQSLEPHL